MTPAGGPARQGVVFCRPRELELIRVDPRLCVIRVDPRLS
jgi:hypothetical protein